MIVLPSLSQPQHLAGHRDPRTMLRDGTRRLMAYLCQTACGTDNQRRFYRKVWTKIRLESYRALY